DGSAQAGSDYVAASGTVSFLPGETSKQIVVKVIGDRLFEPTENCFVLLSNPVNGVVSKDRGTITIVDDDLVNEPPQVRLTSPEEDDSFLAGITISVRAEATDVDGK